MHLNAFILERYLEQHDAAAPHQLGSSEAEPWTIDALLALEPDNETGFRQLSLGYSYAKGHPDLRCEIARLYDDTVSPEQVLVHAGSQEGIFNLMNVLLSPADHVLVHYPCYQSLKETAVSIGSEVTDWPADETKAWALDVDWLRQHLQPNTRLIVLNCPHNPTGYVMSQPDYQALIALCRQHGIYLLVDEVYRWLELDPADRLAAACESYERGITLGGVSKTYGLAGLRIGWVISQDAAMMAELANFKDFISICSSAPSEYLAGIAIRQKDQLVARNLGIIQQNLAVLAEFFEQNKTLLSWIFPKGGTVCFPRFSGGIDARVFCEELIRAEGVLMLPGHCFAYDSFHMRLGFGKKSMPHYLSRVQRFISQWESARQPFSG